MTTPASVSSTDSLRREGIGLWRRAWATGDWAKDEDVMRFLPGENARRSLGLSWPAPQRRFRQNYTQCRQRKTTSTRSQKTPVDRIAWRFTGASVPSREKGVSVLIMV